MTEFQYKLGKLPARPLPTDLKLAEYREPGVALPAHPKTFGHQALVKDWGMLGNDRVGDCVFAGANHEVELWHAEAGTTVVFTDANTLSDYSAVTGYNPADPNTDQGTDVHQALDYRRSTGTVDNEGKRHLIAGYLSLDPGNWDQVLEAAWLFSAVGIGIEFPSSAMDQFNAGKPWTVVKGSPIEGGHYVPVVAYPKRNYLAVVTWGQTQLMSKTFFKKYCDEAYAILSPEMLNAISGKSLEGFDINQLTADLQSL